LLRIKTVFVRRDTPASRKRPWQIFAAIIVTIGMTGPVLAHGIAGNRLFPGTFSFDDPAVADEFVFSPFSTLQRPAPDGHDVVDETVSWSLMRLITPTIGIGFDSGWIHRDWGQFQRSGFDTTNLTLKARLYENDPDEILVPAGFTWGIGGTGAQGVGAGGPNTIQPGIFFGKGFGDLPASLAWLRPFAITGAAVMKFPTQTSTTAFGIDPVTAVPGPISIRAVKTLDWGISIQYSTYYLTDRFTGGPPKEEPLNQFVPLVEFAFISPHGQKTAATMYPGLAYVADTWQLSAQLIVPLNRQAGRGMGAGTQLLLFRDDLIPVLFGKPLLSAGS
jgi:hypothetical protein